MELHSRAVTGTTGDSTAYVNQLKPRQLASRLIAVPPVNTGLHIVGDNIRSI
jgi:hypothetical protein